MLLKIERTILKKISKQPLEHSISYSAFKKYPKEDVKQAFQSLEEKGYFSQTDSSIDYSSFSYVPTLKALYYKEYAFQQFLRDLLIPFIVALLTTIATLYLEKLVENDKSTNVTEYTSDYCSESP